MRSNSIAALLCAVLLAPITMFPAAVLPYDSSGEQAAAKQTPEEILAASAAKGKSLMAALRDYTYNAELTIEALSQADTVTGKYYRFSQVSFDTQGNRQERIVENKSTLDDDLHVGASTANNMVQVYQFILTPQTLSDYQFNYVGREQLDELRTYVFDVQPRFKLSDSDKNGERYLKGRVWIDDQDLQVVKITGQVLTESKAPRTPKFETYYENVNQFWFPSSITADDSIRQGRYSTHVVIKAQFTGYKRVTKKE